MEEIKGRLESKALYNNFSTERMEEEYGYFDSDSSVERTVKPAKNGNTVVSTIDVTLQNIVENAF